jgi:hypothetical protein
LPLRLSFFFVLCFGPLFTAASTARSNRPHAPGSVSISSGFGFLGGFAMAQKTKPHSPKSQDMSDEDFLFAIDQLEQHVRDIGTVVTAWNRFQKRLGQLFAKLLTPTRLNRGLAVWHAVENDRAQRAMLAAIAHERLQNDENMHKEVRWLLGKANQLADLRNDVIHTPYLVILYEEDWSMTLTTDHESGHKRAARLKDSDLAIEIQTRSNNIAKLSEFTLALRRELNRPRHKRTLPRRPSLPRPPQSGPRKARAPKRTDK